MGCVIVHLKTHQENTMETIRINVSLPKEVFVDLSDWLRKKGIKDLLPNTRRQLPRSGQSTRNLKEP